MNLEEEIADKLAKEISQEIDFELLADIMVACGWTKVVLPNKFLPVSGQEIHEWRERNLTGRWKAHNRTWIFEDPKDAVIFTLRWM